MFAETLTMKDALRSLWCDLSELRTKRERRHLVLLRKHVADEAAWSWALTDALAMMRHFSDVRALDIWGMRPIIRSPTGR